MEDEGLTERFADRTGCTLAQARIAVAAIPAGDYTAWDNAVREMRDIVDLEITTKRAADLAQHPIERGACGHLAEDGLVTDDNGRRVCQTCAA